MATRNRYFNFTTRASEQNLIQDLIDEAIEIYGHDAYYLPRQDVDINHVFGEDELATYPQATPVVVYLKSSQSFRGASEYISKFGLTIEDQSTFIISARHWSETFVNSLIRPREGDVIWIEMTPDNRYLFEINFVENKEQLFQLGKLYTYEIQCEMLTFAHERITTGNTTINDSAQREAFTLSLMLDAGSGAYTPGEMVYQGDSFISADATGTVYEYDDTLGILYVQDIVGTFSVNTDVIGVTSHASYTILTEPDIHTSTTDPIADNAEIETDVIPMIVSRGSNPRFS